MYVHACTYVSSLVSCCKYCWIPAWTCLLALSIVVQYLCYCMCSCMYLHVLAHTRVWWRCIFVYQFRDAGPFQWVMMWRELISTQQYAAMLEKHFFPKWIQVLSSWLVQNPNFDEVTRWYDCATPFQLLQYRLCIFVHTYLYSVYIIFFYVMYFPQVHGLERSTWCRPTERTFCEASPQRGTRYDEQGCGWDLSAWGQRERCLSDQFREKVGKIVIHT